MGNPLVDMEVAGSNNVSLIGGLYGCTRYWVGYKCSIEPSYTNKNKAHKGIDLKASVGTDVYSMFDGEVIKAVSGIGCDKYKALGNKILIKSTHAEHQKGTGSIWIYYAHLTDVDVKVGDKIEQGDKIGTTGKTGNACKVINKHLHIQIYKDSYKDSSRVSPDTYITTKFDKNGNKKDD
ncbi:MAG: M23 family metallopeptidase [Flavobacteriaceae bacterium]|nr:M23 family metallopeptidase [Flavobacteriaceae bacterium]